MAIASVREKIIISTRPAVTLRVATDGLGSDGKLPVWQYGPAPSAQLPTPPERQPLLNADHVWRSELSQPCAKVQIVQTQLTNVHAGIPAVKFSSVDSEASLLDRCFQPLLSAQVPETSQFTIERSLQPPIACHTRASFSAPPILPLPAGRRKRKFRHSKPQKQICRQMKSKSQPAEQHTAGHPITDTISNGLAAQGLAAHTQSQLPAWLPQDLPFVLDVCNTDGILWDVESLPPLGFEAPSSPPKHAESSKGSSAQICYHDTSGQLLEKFQGWFTFGNVVQATEFGGVSKGTTSVYSPSQLEAAQSLGHSTGSTESSLSMVEIDKQDVYQPTDWQSFLEESCTDLAAAEPKHEWVKDASWDSSSTPTSATALDPTDVMLVPWSTAANSNNAQSQTARCQPQGATIMTGGDSSSEGMARIPFSNRPRSAAACPNPSSALSGGGRTITTAAFSSTVSTGFDEANAPWKKKQESDSSRSPSLRRLTAPRSLRLRGALCRRRSRDSASALRSSNLLTGSDTTGTALDQKSRPRCKKAVGAIGTPAASESALIMSGNQRFGRHTESPPRFRDSDAASGSVGQSISHSAEHTNVQLAPHMPARSVVLQLARGSGPLVLPR